MHILVVNDDGPPSQVSSPYVHSFVSSLQAAGHIVSVVLPHAQRSWIGKAHLVGKTVTPTYFRPGTLHTDDGTTHDRPRRDGGEEWILVDGTPASCAQIGIHHYFRERGEIDLVVSGPNYGRNSTALFALSSGTIGGAMEAAVCGKRAIALSYAFFNRNHDPEIIKAASTASVRIVEYLSKNWKEGTDLYSVNVPLLEGVDKPETKCLYTHMLQNYWSSGSSFEPVDAEDELSPEQREAEIREGEGEGDQKQEGERKGLRHVKFKWDPKFTDVYESVEKSEPGNDGWAVWKGHISITPLKANFMHHAPDLIGQEIQLIKILSLSENKSSSKNYAVVDYEDAYVEPKILAALRKYIPDIQTVKTPEELPKDADIKVINWSAYEKIPFEDVMEKPDNVLSCSYIIRKALIRKHHLSLTIRHHVAKVPSCALSRAFPLTCDFELDFAEFLDEALMEAFELSSSLESNSSLSPAERQWWILKPGMSDRGQGIRLFSTLEELEEIFQSWEEESDEEDDEDAEYDEYGNKIRNDDEDDEAGDNDEDNEDEDGDDGIVTSQLRHFVAQEYLHPPLLVDNRKFHIRVYVLAVGGLKVYVYRKMLALFAAREYAAPWVEEELTAHLTNTCLQTGEREGSVRLFWDLGKEVGREKLEGVWGKVCEVVGDVFEGAARGQRVHFQPLPNAFEIYGVDFLVGQDMEISLLEVNAYPDFKQTGAELSAVIEGLLEETTRIAVAPFFGGEEEKKEEGAQQGDMVLVREIGLGSF
ncbi:survival protein sure-like phosphatase/nucleotidase [Pyronema domesticum]|nr:survival protein sure-like phosphatase/nucleotidase [Pyronema domesticum]